MILTVALDPEVIRRIGVDNFEVGKEYKISDVTYVPEGGGLNIAKVIDEFNEDVFFTGLLGGENGHYARNYLSNRNISNMVIAIEDKTKGGISIVTKDNIETKIEEQGPIVKGDELNRFYNMFRDMVFTREFICISGKVPRGCKEDIYYDLITVAKKYNKKVLFSSEGIGLEKALKADPDFVLLRKDDLENLYNIELIDEDTIIGVCKGYIDGNDKMLIVDMDLNSYYIFYREKCILIKYEEGPKIIRNQGYNDAFIGGYLSSIIRGYDLIYSFKIGAASALASAGEFEAGKLDMTNMKYFLGTIDTEFIDI